MLHYATDRDQTHENCDGTILGASCQACGCWYDYCDRCVREFGGAPDKGCRDTQCGCHPEKQD